MNNLLKVNIILFCIYMIAYTIIDHYYLKQDVKWGYNLVLAVIFSLLVSRLITNKS